MCYDFSNSRLIIFFFSMEGGELFQRIQDRQDGAFTERGTISHSYGICLFKTPRVFLSNIIQKLYAFLQKPRK